MIIKIVGFSIALALSGCAAVGQCTAPAMTTISANVLGQVGGLVRSVGFDGAGLLTGVMNQLGGALACIAGKLLSGNAGTPVAFYRQPQPMLCMLDRRRSP